MLRAWQWNQAASLAGTERVDWWRDILVLAAVAMALSGLLRPQLMQLARPLAPGQAAPDFRVTFMPDGEFAFSDAYRQGRPVLLMFYEPDCLASQRALARLNDLVDARPDLIIIAVNARPHAARELGDFYRQLNVAGAPPRFIWVVDPDAATARLYHVPNLYPLWFFIRPYGVIAAVRAGEHVDRNLIVRANELLPPSADYLLEQGIR